MGWFWQKKEAVSTPAQQRSNAVQINRDILQAIALVQGTATPEITQQIITPDTFPITAAQQKLEEADLNPVPGHLMRDGTIYLGKYRPKDRAGKDLGKLFNVYAAPHDLPEMMTYTNTVKYIATLKIWNGFHGTSYANDKEIYAALQDGSYDGGWIIPPRELLTGSAPDSKTGIHQGENIQPDNLFAHRNTGAFTGTFKTGEHCTWYWSSTSSRNKEQTHVWGISFFGGTEDFDHKDGFVFSCRPVRLVEVKPSRSA